MIAVLNSDGLGHHSELLSIKVLFTGQQAEGNWNSALVPSKVPMAYTSHRFLQVFCVGFCLFFIAAVLFCFVLVLGIEPRAAD